MRVAEIFIVLRFSHPMPEQGHEGAHRTPGLCPPVAYYSDKKTKLLLLFK